MRGVTLVELLIVILILGVLGSLVAPVAFKSIDSAQAETDYLKLDRQLDMVAFQAYARGAGATVRLAGSEMHWTVGDGYRGVEVFPRLFFPKEQTVIFAPSGVATPASVDVLVAGSAKELGLNRW